MTFYAADFIKLEVNTSSGVWTDLTAKSLNITIDRESGDVGLMTASVFDPSIDPTTSSLIKSGQTVRVRALDGSTWRYLYTGFLRNVSVTYDKKNRPTIVLKASDAVTRLANAKTTQLMANIASLRALLASLPFDLNGSNVPGGGTTLAYVKDPLSVWESMSMTRDWQLGYLWVAATGVIKGYDDAHIATTPVMTISTSVYRNLEADFSTEDIVNSVAIDYVRYNATSGDSTTVPYGPYEDSASIAAYGRRAATFTLSLATESSSAITAYANSVLAVTVDDTVKARSADIPITSAAEVARGCLDLMDPVNVVFTDDTTNRTTRVVAVSHTIGPKSWQVTYSFGSGHNFPTGSGGIGGSISNGSITPDMLDPSITSDIDAALAAADSAMAFASAAVRVYRQASAPTGTIPTNAVWYDTDDGNRTYVYNGSTWVDTTTSWLKTNPSSTFPGLTISPAGLAAYDGSGSVSFSIASATGSVNMKGSLTSGSTIDGAVITGGTIQTESTSSRGVKLSSTGLSAYDASGNPTFNINASTGAITMKGSLVSGSSVTVGASGSYLTELTTAGEVRFSYAGSPTAMVRATSSGVAIGNTAGTSTWFAADPSFVNIYKTAFATSGLTVSGGLTSNGSLNVDQIRPNTSGTIALGTASDVVTAYGFLKTGAESVNVSSLNTNFTKAVTFGTAFASSAPLPKILLTLQDVSGDNGTFKLSATSISRSGFTIQIVRDAGSTGTVSVAWLAIAQ